MAELPEIRWIDLPGVVNMRDLGGKPAGAAATRFGSVIRTDNLQDLPPASVRRLVDELGVTDVVDLRTDVERASTGDGPLAAEGVRFHTLSLYPEDSMEHGIPDPDTDEPPTFPWQGDFAGAAQAEVGHDTHLANHYFGYLEGRPDNIVAALRAIAAAPGAVLVHCAAGKDRTGTISAMALTVAGVDRDAVVADYDATNERVELIFERLRSSDTYRADLEGQVVADQATPAESMRMLLQVLDEQFGAGHANGVEGWLAGQGWTAEDTERLRAKLLEQDA